MWENADQNNSEYRHFSHSEYNKNCSRVLRSENFFLLLSFWGVPGNIGSQSETSQNTVKHSQNRKRSNIVKLLKSVN